MTVFRGVCRENIIKAVPRQTQAISNSFIKNIVKGKHHWITPVSANQAWTDCLGAQNFWDKLILRVCTFCLLERYNEWHQSLHFKGLHVEKTIKIWKKERKKERKLPTVLMMHTRKTWKNSSNFSLHQSTNYEVLFPVM